MRQIRLLLLILLFPLVTSPIAALADSSLPNNPNNICPVLIGSYAPDITLKTGAGQAYDLYAALNKKPTILIFYRGGW